MYRALSVPRFEQPPRTPHYSPMLHNAVVAYFARAAHALVFQEIQRPNISTVLALAFIGTFYADNGDRAQGELFFGMSSRLSLTLGMGVDSTPWVKSGLIAHDEMIGRNWAHWTIYSLDVCWALYFGREFVGPPRRSTPMPFIDSEMDRQPWHHPPSNIPPQPNYLTRVFFESSTLLVIGRQITDVVNGLRHSSQSEVVPVHEHITRIDQELNNWKRQLPPQLDITPANRRDSTPQRLMLHLVYWWCSITLHRPFFNRRTPEIDHARLCTHAAENILELLETWSTVYTIRLASLTMQQVIFSAGTIFLLRALQATASPPIAHDVLRTALAQAETSVRYLHELGQTWTSAMHAGDILHTMLEGRLKPVIKRRLGERISPRASHLESPAVFPVQPTPSYTSGWTSQLDPAAAWSPPSQMQSAPAIFHVESSFSQTAVPDPINRFFLPDFGYFGAPELWEEDLSDSAGPIPLTAWASASAHFEALRKRADALQAYVERLEGLLANGKIVKEEVDSDLDVLDSDEEITKELTVPTQALKLDDRTGKLILHGIASSPLRFGPGHKPPADVCRIPEVVQNPDATYVLQLDGVDISQTHPDIDWSRHLPPEVALDRREHDRILDVSFKFCNMWCLRIMPSFFLRDMYRALSVPRSEKPPKTSHYSPLLHNAILSIYSVFSDNAYLRDLKTRQFFFRAAKASIEVEALKPDISLVAGLAFIGTFYADVGERIQAELFCGKSSRLDVTLGLGVDAKPWVRAGLLSEDERVGRNWAHWAIFSLDVCWSLYFGRDYCGPPGPRRNIPMPFVDSEYDQIPWYHPHANIAPQPNYTTLIFFQSSNLLVIAREIIDVVNGLSASTRPDAIQIDEHITKIDLQLNNWKSQLPPHIDITLANRVKSTPQRLMLHIAYWWCFIVLHRPFFNRRAQPIQHSDREVDHDKLCLRAAENILELVETWQLLYTLRLVPVTMGQVVFNAGTIFMLRALQATASPRIAHGALNTALAQLETCIKYLNGVGETWPSAARIRDTLQAILNDRLRPVIARRLAVKGEQIPSPPVIATPPFPSLDNPSAVAAVTPSLPSLDSPSAGGNVESSLSTMPAPTYDTSGWNKPCGPNWSPATLDFFAQVQNAPAASAFGADILDAFADADMTALLPNIEYFGAPDLWQQNVFDEKTAAVLFS
ncbi:Zn(2)-C6 fungal-type domain-containing protein [Mycena sanguinolenta]|uniref:Zn(2)-C6 fungal-type domain-containing protein n=1 Tax=Mycena sanguinolenta TaxID=230812 RepID=A0A8H6YWX9_9AGAR|nr:Zn(2)-C6 fungal-type domain-containing protein [Mycena sanguinolenta]